MKWKSSSWDPAAYPTFWINQASRGLMRHFEQRLRPLDMGMAYLPVLFALDETGGLLQKDLAARANVEQPTMAALLGRMERDGLVARTPHPDDKRAAKVSLTTKGRGRIPKAKERLFEVYEQAMKGFSEKESETLMALLQRVAENLEET